MQITFTDAAGTVLFVRDDMEQGNWTQEEYTVNATFPYDSGKVIIRGQRLAFSDPATGTREMFEVRNVTNIEPDHYQQIIAEHIVVSELSDEHINKIEITNKTPKQALTSVLAGTLWSAGNTSVTATSSVDIARGNVWQAVGAIMQNWNCYITPRITYNSAGSITGRYLDIIPAQGTWRGVRLSVSKNISDSSVVYDDSELYTALYGYGGSVEVTHTTGDDTTEELTFADVVWSATSAHPAKPSGQTYLEDPAKTALYGRDGRARFGYYQNSDIDDANTLLEKTWETLKQVSVPKISITGTVTDLYRLGYADQPLRLHDTAIVEIAETGERFEKEIIKLDVDLLDPTASRVDIGDYIANIIYINRNTDIKASGGGGGGGGRAGSDNKGEEYDTFSALEKRTDEFGSMIGMVVGRRNGDNYIKAGEIALSINSTSGESTAYIDATHVNISASSTAYALAGDVQHDADGKLIIKSAGGMYVQRTEQGITSQFGVWDHGNLTGLEVTRLVNGDSSAYLNADHVNISGTSTVQTIAGAMERDASGHLVIKEGAGLYAEHTVGGSTASFGVWDNGNITSGMIVSKINGETSATIKADYIDIQGLLSAFESEAITCGNLTCDDLSVDQDVIAGGSIQGLEGSFGSGGVIISDNGLLDCYDIDCGDVSADDMECATLKVGSSTASWQSFSYDTLTYGTYRYFLYGTSATSTTAEAAVGMYPVTGHSSNTIYYLGHT